MSPAFAQSSAEPSSSSAVKRDDALWVSFGFVSRHDDRKANYNEDNTGFGLEYQSSPEHWWSAGVYRNSVRETSTYLQYGWMPLSIGPVRFGAAAGIVNGYPRLNHGDWAPTLLPVIGFEVGRVGANLLYIPSIAGNVAGAVALQVKLKVF